MVVPLADAVVDEGAVVNITEHAISAIWVVRGTWKPDNTASAAPAVAAARELPRQFLAATLLRGEVQMVWGRLQTLRNGVQAAPPSAPRVWRA